MEQIISNLLAYLISLAANLRMDAITRGRQERLEKIINKHTSDLYAIENRKSLAEHLDQIGIQISKTMDRLKISAPPERALFQLLADPMFRKDLADWLIYWDLSEAEAAMKRLQERMAEVMARTGVKAEHIETFRRDFFIIVDNVVFGDGKLAHWRHHLGLRAIKEGQDEILRRMRENDGDYDSERLNEAQNRYREAALKTCDIIDLAGLPEDDRHLAMQNFVLRQLYIPLRVEAENILRQEIATQDSESLSELEKDREKRRLLVAGRYHEQAQSKNTEDNRLPVGSMLESDRRLVILADPGSGKTTLMRWFVTAFLLRLKDDPDLAQLPDAATLPKADYLPFLIRCRELPENAHCLSINDMLHNTVGLHDLPPSIVGAVLALFRKRMEEGSAILMIDGLDEIQNPMMRARFCRRIETLAAIYGETRMLITSRIVGYQEMPFRMGRGFRHGVISDLTPGEMDEFAERWVHATEPEQRRELTRKDLTANIHSNERVERLAGNPMLLTTLALVHRKIGRLPQRRVELYREAIQVLLNWRGDIDERLDWDEAIPQLEYVAYAMCQKGVQRLARATVIELIEEMRGNYRTRLREIEKRSSSEFIDLLERRSSILIKAGFIRSDGRETPVYEFRHLTFQEYLAGLALRDGRFPGHEKGIRLAERVAPLAGVLEKTGSDEKVTSENWREPLRLCLACCNDDDVDDAMLAILRPGPDESEDVEYGRSVMATLCLSDEPNVSEDVAFEVLKSFSSRTWEGPLRFNTALGAALKEVSKSIWGTVLCKILIEGFLKAAPGSNGYAEMCSEACAYKTPQDPLDFEELLERLSRSLSSEDEPVLIESMLTLMHLAYSERLENKSADELNQMFINSLFGLLGKEPHLSLAAAWALCWLSGGWRKDSQWRPEGQQVDGLIRFCSDFGQPSDALRFAGVALAHSLDDKARLSFSLHLEHEDEGVRRNAVEGLAKLMRLEKDYLSLLSAIDEVNAPPLMGIDPREPINNEIIERKAKLLKLTRMEVRKKYEYIANPFKLRLPWLYE
jgi:hypothetical protein